MAASQEQAMSAAGDSSSANPWEQTDLLALVSPAPEAARLASQPASTLPERLLIVDTETTGLDPQRHRCIEVGAVLFDVPHRAVLSQVSFLLPCQDNPAVAVNGIPPAVSQRPQPWKASLQCFGALLGAADVVLAHNAAFDRQWFGREPLPAIEKPWLCSMEDLRWPAERQLKAAPSVRDLALAYGVPVWAAHRALTDCIYLAQVLERCDELEPLLIAGLEPRRLYRARLSYEERHQAKDAGFRWNEPVPGAWSRRLSEREASLLPFPVVPVDTAGSERLSA
jgi:DNA polymerase-3 subunit epsilon